MRHAPWLRILHLSNLMNKKAYYTMSEADLPYLSHSAFQILLYLRENRERTVMQKELEKQLMSSRATVSKMLLLLEKKGYISREDSEADARQKLVRLTDSGDDFLHRHYEIMQKLESFYGEVLTEEEMKTFESIYEKLVTALTDSGVTEEEDIPPFLRRNDRNPQEEPSAGEPQ